MSTICPRFAQNAWKKDLCSNCFKSKEEHKTANNDTKPLKLIPFKQVDPPKGIMKSHSLKLPKGNVTFPEELTQVIGFGGEWSDDECCSDAEIESPQTTPEDVTKEIDELEQELLKLTKVNTNYNMSNANLSMETDDSSIKQTFATLQLGTPVKDSDGKKQTLKISVLPFGGPVTTNKVNDIKQKFSNFDDTKPPVVLKTIIKSTGVEYVEESAKTKSVSDAVKPEKTLLEEISETLEKNKERKENESKAKLEIKKGSFETKRSISRHAPIVKDQAKPKISVFPKFSDPDCDQSDNETGSGYYDVVEASTLSSSNYENLPNSYDVPDNISTETNEALNNEIGLEIRNKSKSTFFSNHLISEMFSSGKDRKNSRGYNFMSKITTDGLIVAKASSDDAMDSTGSSFDYATSSDEEMSSMNRSESDSGIGICVTNSPNEFEKEMEIMKGNGNMDYEDIQIPEEQAPDYFSPLDKNRELPEKRREPDGSADPDPDRKSQIFESEAPALPSSPPPPINSEPRVSFLHKTNVKEKPTVPIKPTVSIIKAFVKRTPNVAEQQVITQLQQMMKPYSAIDTTSADTSEVSATKVESSDTQKMKKTRAPEPPSPTDTRPNNSYENVEVTTEKCDSDSVTEIKIMESVSSSHESEENSGSKSKTDDQYSYIYTRNPTGSIGKSSPVIREKDKRERATINPKFRSLNTFSSNYKNHTEKARPTTPEPVPRKVLSMSQDSLLDDKKKKNKFSIKKFLRMGSNKSSEPIYGKRESAYGKMVVGDKDGMPGDRSSKPRLVIIHPIDINQMEVEVVKEMGKVSEIVTGKPPPPLRKGLNAMNKPTRPPPPKSAEVRKKLKLGFNEMNAQKPLVKEDSVYANLGEIRSAIAPRKPERTASMREREAQLELARKRLSSKHEFEEIDLCESAQSTLEKASPKTDVCKVSNRLELFERTITEQKTKSAYLNDGIRTSMQKINSTIDSYLKDRMEESEESKSPLQSEDVNKSNRNSEVELRNNYEPIALHSQRSSLPDNSSNYKIADLQVGRVGYAKSDYGARYHSQSVGKAKRKKE